MLGPLLRSVADNVETLGFPDALTGPVRRGDAAGVEKHLATLREKLPGRGSALPGCRRGAASPGAAPSATRPRANLDAVKRVIEAGKTGP